MDFSKIPTIDDLGDLQGKTVLVRADFNVPMQGGAVTSVTRITAALPTIELLFSKGARVIICSHLGRPKGEGLESELSLAPVAKRLSDLLGHEVKLLSDCVGDDVRDGVDKLEPGYACLLENLRFHKEEKSGDEAFGRELASLTDAYVNDAFGTSHRAHASMTWPAKLLPSAAGLLVRKEIDAMGKVLTAPAKPYAAVLGGAKISDKIPLVDNLLSRVNEVVIGGGMAYTFLAAQGHKVGKSLLDASKIEDCQRLLVKAAELDVLMHLPKDHVVAEGMDDESAHEVTGDIPSGQAAFDIGPKTAKEFSAAIGRAKTVLFNGPMGVFERSRFSNGTQLIVQAIADATEAGAFSVVGGGDSASAAEHFGFAEKMSHISTGGGASLTLLQGAEMPAFTALLK
ncbi:MAG: phosphoglycerate kinase [Planctomycetota bacterium]|jgi:phosphoglycerate kinase